MSDDDLVSAVSGVLFRRFGIGVADLALVTREILEAIALAVTARDCRNCLECSSRPCDACCAGGICDRECHCDDLTDDYDGEHEYDFGDEPGGEP